MALSRVTYPSASGTTQIFAIPFPFISRTHITGTVNNVAAVFTFDNDSQVTISTPTVLAGQEVRFVRTTPKSTDADILVDYQDGTGLPASDLDLTTLQMFYMAQENFDDLQEKMGLLTDGSSDWDGQSKNISDITDPVLAQDVATKNYGDTNWGGTAAAAAVAAQAAAELAETNAETAETNAETAETNAATSETNAAVSEANAAGSVITAVKNYQLETVKNLEEVRHEDFVSGHGFTLISGSGTQSDDTVVHLNGSQSLKFVTNGANSALRSRGPTLPAPVDFTGQSPVIQIKVSGLSALEEIRVYLASDDFAGANHFIFNFQTAFANNAIDGEWITLTLNFDEATIVGSPDRTIIDRIQLRTRDDSSGVVTANWATIGMTPEPSEGMVSITFDSGWDSQFDEAKKIMSEYGIPATAYAIANKIGTAGYMTVAQLHELEQLHLWEVSTHHETDLTTLTLSAAEIALQDAKTFLVDNDFRRGVDNFSIPDGAFNAGLLALFRKYFRTSRTLASGSKENFPPADWSRIRVLNILDTTTTGAIATAIDDARTFKTWLVLVFHKIVTTSAASDEYNIADFQTVIDDLDADGITVKTITQAIDKDPVIPDSLDVTTKGDLQTFSTVGARLAVGADATILTADSVEATGLKWATPASASIIQIVENQLTARVSGTAVTPHDNTIPTITEGIEILNQSITPATSGNKILIEFSGWIDTHNVTGGFFTLHMHLDAVSAAIAVQSEFAGTLNQPKMAHFSFIYTTSTTSAHVFRIRMGSSSGGTIMMCGGHNNAAIYGAINKTSLVLSEIKV